MSSAESSLVLEAVRALLPDVPLNTGVKQANTGVILLDSLPLLTMAPAAKTLQLFWRRGRRLDFALFLAGWLLAIVYHVLHMHPEGIANAELLGLSGATWRGLDILMAQALLARTCGHAVGARSPAARFVSNLVFPGSLLAYAHLLADGVLTLGVASKVLVLVLLSTLLLKAALEDSASLPAYCPRRRRKTVACFALGFAVFPLPELLPRHYWLFHSLWHVLMAEGYYQLYVQLEGLHLSASSDAQHGWRLRAGGKQAGDAVYEEADEEESEAEEGIYGSEAEEEEGEEESGMERSDGEEESSGEGEEMDCSSSSEPASPLSRSRGLAYALLQPAVRLLRYQRQQERLERRRAVAAVRKEQ